VTFKAKAKKAAPKRSSRKGVVRFKTRDGWVAFKAKR
jgi:hypothetical protein